MAEGTAGNANRGERPPPCHPARAVCGALLAAWAGIASAGEPAVLRPAAGRPLPTARPAARFDSAVVPAGGDRAQRCGHCGRAACPKCRQTGGHAQPHSHCQHGMCPAHCPVRPDVFGFYGTQWRRWPGSGVVPASASDAAAPARPARSQVPSAAEESLPRTAADEPAEPREPPGETPEPPADPSQPSPEPFGAAGPQEDGNEAIVPGREDRDAAATLRRTAWRSFTQAARLDGGP